MSSQPIVPFCSPSSLALHRKGFFLSNRSILGFCASAISALWSDAEAIHECIFVLSRAVTRGTVDCTFVRTDAWLDFSRDLVSLWSKTRQGQKVDAVTVRLSPQLALPVSQRTDDHVPDQCVSLRNSFDNKSGAPPGTTSTRSTPLTPAIPTGSMARVLVSVSHRYQNGRSWPS